MSLGVKLDQVKGPSPPGDRVARVTFRGASRVSRLFQHAGDIGVINQLLEWPIARGINGDEKLEIQILAYNKFLSNRVMFHVSFSLHQLLDESCIQLAASLLDNTDKPTKAVLYVVVWYSGPGQHNNITNNMDSDMEDDSQALLNLERNIANIERSMSASQLTKSDLTSILNRQHGSNQSLNTVGVTAGSRSNRSKFFTTQETSKRKNISLKTVKNALSFGRRRSASGSEEQNLLCSSQEQTDRDTEDEGGLESQDETDRIINHMSATGRMTRRDSVNSLMSDNQSIVSHTKPGASKKKTKKSNRSKSSSGWQNTLKAQDYQVCITVIEARQLAGLNMDPVVCVQVGDSKKWTSVKESTNCPYYNEVQHRQLLRPGIVLGSFKLDIATVMAQQDHQFYHKWALLTDPDDISGGVKGYLKCDISVITKGDAIKIPPKSERDEDDIEANLLVPVGVTSTRQRAKFIVRVYRADGLPRMNSSIMSNLKHAFGAQTRDLVNPYVQVSFAGLTGRTSVKRNSYNPIWNEQIVFTEMFPPLCQRIKIQLKESDTVGDTVIGTHYIDLSTISNDGDKGYLPTFGPAFVHLYGSTRDFSFIDEHSTLNDGMGEGVSYRGQLLIAIKTEISDSIDTAPSEVEVEQTQTINEAVYNKHEDFFLFGSIMDATMIDKRMTDKPMSFEISLGNAGNSLDGQTQSTSATQNEDDEETLKATWHSTTPPMKPESHDRLYYFLPMADDKPCLYIRALQPDHRRRMYTSNALSKIVDKLEEQLHEVHSKLEAEHEDADAKLKEAFETLYHSCGNFSLLCTTPNTGLSMTGKTRLDKERLVQCQKELETIGAQAKQWKLLTNRATVKEKFRGAQGFLERIKSLVEDPQHALPDIFIWMISGARRVAYHRIPARTILYSMIDEECGQDCGKLQTIFLKAKSPKNWDRSTLSENLELKNWLPGKRGLGSGGWQIQAKVQIYLWLGLIKHKKCYPSGLPPGFKLTEEILNAEKPTLPPPINIHYNEKHYFQVRAYIYQARSLIGSDESGLSDPFARVVIGEYCKTTQVIEETLSPTWDESMLFEEILIYGRREDIKANPPLIIIETYDQDKVGKAEFLGRATARPHVYLEEETNYSYPKLEWFQIYRGTEEAGELLAAFEMFELGDCSRPLPPLPPVKNEATQLTGPIMPIPPEIRPTLVKYRFEVLFWGLRDLKRVQFLTVDKPRVDIECGGHIIQSTVIQDANKNPNFTQNVKFLDIELPEQEMYCPPLSIRVVDCRSFGRFTLVGNHTSPSIHKYLYHPITGEMREDMNRRRNQSLLRTTQETSFQNLDYLISSDGVSPTSSPWNKSKETLISMEHGTYIAVETVPDSKATTGDNDDDDEECMDWWTKYHASLDNMIEIYPIVDVNYDVGHFLSDVRDINQLNPETIARLTSQVSSLSASMFDVSNLKKSSHLSASSPNLAAPGLLSRFGRKKSKLATSKTHLLKSTEAGLDNAGFVEDSMSVMSVQEGKSNRGDSVVGGMIPALEKDSKEKDRKKKTLATFKSVTQVTKAWGNRLSPKLEKKKVKSKVALMKVYPNELESQPEFDEFSEWLHTFDLYRGKKSEDDLEDENRVVGRFKGAIKIYKLPLPKDLDDYTVMGNDPRHGFFQGLPSNEPLRVLVRAYVVKANDLHPMDINGKADPYLVLQLGNKRISDKDHYVSKQLNPVFGKCFEVEASFPQDSVLTVQVYDWDLLGGDDLIGETKIDLENRFYSRHRSTCGLSAKYDPCGYNEWRDPMKPTQILTKLCKEGKIDGPHFHKNKVTVGDKVFTVNSFKTVTESPSTAKIQEEQLALGVLHHWDQIARVGFHLVPEHVETRALYNPDKPGIEQGKVEMWVDMFPLDMPPPKFQVDISPRKPTSWELRVIVWNTDEVVLEDDAFFSGDKMSDIYVKGWLTGPEDSQATDVHYRSLTGEGNFNWRFVFAFEYLAAEEKIVITKKESLFSWDDSITKVPPRLTLQVWDADSFSKDDFLGSIMLDLNKFPRGAKTAKQCNLEMLKTDGSVPTMNLFKSKRTKGWWPMYAKDENDELILQGKVEAELILMTSEEAEKSPAGLGREEPNALEKPTRPDSSFMWFLNPIKSIRYIIWHNYKWTILKICFFLFLTLFIALFFYSLPGYTIKKMLGA